MPIAALAAVLSQPLVATQSAPTAAPSALATEQFNTIMNGTPAPSVAAGGSPLAVQTGLTPPTDATPTLGNRILSGLQTEATQYTQKWQDIAANLQQIGPNPSMSSMLRLQTDLLQVSVQYELVGKAVSRTTQNVDNLVRMS